MRSIRGSALALLRDEGPMARSEIARRLRLSPATITRVVSQLEADGSLAEGDALAAVGAGRPATALHIRAASKVVAGVQIGIGVVLVGLTDALGRQLASSDFRYAVEDGPEVLLRRVADEILALRQAKAIDRSALIGVGVIVPGPVDAAGQRMQLSIHLQWRDVPIAEMLGRLTGLPVTVDHNVRAMALAEARFGQGRGLGSVAFVYLRTGLGAGLVVEGQPFSGGVHGAVELGHLQVLGQGSPCVCGGRGCIETLVSESALRATVRRLGIETETNRLAAIWALANGGLASTGTARRRSGAGQQARHRDERQAEADAAISTIVTGLATGLGALITLLNPALVLLGGALGDIPDGLFERIEAQTRLAAFPVIRDSIRLSRSELGADAGLAGGATVALEQFFYG